MKTINKYFKLLAIVIVGITIIDLLEIDKFVYKVFTNKDNYDLPFWEALIAISTIITIIFALLGNSIQKAQDEENESEKIIKNIKSEIFINFDQLQESALAKRGFEMETRQLDMLLENSRFINLEAEGIFRPLRIFYTSAKRFNERMLIIDSDGYFKSIDINRDCIKHMLHIFSLCDEIGFEEVDKSMIAINNFCSRDKLTIADFDELKNGLSANFWKLNDFKYNMQIMGSPVDYEQMRKVLLRESPSTIDLLEQKDTVLNFLIERLASLKHLKKTTMMQNLEKKLRSLVTI